MANQTVAAHLDPKAHAAFKQLVSIENRNPSQVIGVVLKSFLDYSPGARRALFGIDGIADETERAFAARLIGRSILNAYEDILHARQERKAAMAIGSVPDDDDAIEAKAVRICSE